MRAKKLFPKVPKYFSKLEVIIRMLHILALWLLNLLGSFILVFGTYRYKHLDIVVTHRDGTI